MDLAPIGDVLAPVNGFDVAPARPILPQLGRAIVLVCAAAAAAPWIGVWVVWAALAIVVLLAAPAARSWVFWSLVLVVHAVVAHRQLVLVVVLLAALIGWSVLSQADAGVLIAPRP